MVTQRLIVTALMLCHCQMASANGLGPTEAADLARAALRAAGMTQAEPIAPSRALPDCTLDVVAQPPQPGARRVDLLCSAPAWTRSLRLRDETAARSPRVASAEADNFPQVQVLALRRAMNKGEVITDADLVRVTAPARGPEAVFQNPADIVGRRLARAVAPERPLVARHLDPEVLIEAGQPVLIQSETNGLQISVRGQSLADGSAGDLVDVVNMSSGRTVTARVIGRNTVEVALKYFARQP